LELYTDQAILACLDIITAKSGKRRVFVTGHSLGGSFVAIFSAIHGELVQGLILL
jgi:pimeloyl-ACP methyl ester carboxylesterase